MTAPILGWRSIPNSVRLLFAGLITLSVFVSMPPPQAIPDDLILLVGYTVREAALGAITGLTSRIALDSALMAGQVGGTTMGANFGAIVDPANGAAGGGPAQFYAVGSLGFAVWLGLHHDLVMWLFQSSRAIPPGQAIDLIPFLRGSIEVTLQSIALGIRLAFPVLAAVTFGHITLGIVGRSASQLNLASIGFSIAILSGAFALYLTAPAAMELAARAAIEVFHLS